MHGNDIYYTNEKSKCPDGVRFGEKDKFVLNVMLWLSIFSRGLSKTIFRASYSYRLSIRTAKFINFIGKSLLPFV